MSNLFKSFRETLDSTGFAACLITFFSFCICWSLGYVSGVILVILGLRGKIEEEMLRRMEEEEIEEMVARMNEEGPNN